MNTGSVERKNLKVFFRSGQNLGLIFALIAIIIFFQIITGGIFLRPLNVAYIILQNSYVMVLAIGMLLCILTGNVDLSVGSVVAFVSAISGVLMVQRGMHPVPAVAICLAIGAIIGIWHGFWIAYVGVPAFIATLGGMLIFRGLTSGLLYGRTLGPFPVGFQNISAEFIPDPFGVQGFHVLTMLIGIALACIYSFLQISRYRKQKSFGISGGNLFGFATTMVFTNAIILYIAYLLSLYMGIPNVMVLLSFLILSYTFVTQHTTMGRHIYAFGGNQLAARLSGINTKRVFFWVYVNMSVLAALAGLVYAARLNAASPRAGVSFELDAIAACYLGGASAAGGIGTVAGSIVGALIIGVMNSGMSLMGLGVDWQQAIKGLVLIIAVAFDILSRKS